MISNKIDSSSLPSAWCDTLEHSSRSQNKFMKGVASACLNKHPSTTDFKKVTKLMNNVVKKQRIKQKQ